MSSYRVNIETIDYDYYQCYETNDLPMFCEESWMTYHKECFIAEARKKKTTRNVPYQC